MNISLPVDCVLFLGSEVRVETRHVERIIATWRSLFEQHRGAGWAAPVVGALFPGEESYSICGGETGTQWHPAPETRVRVGGDDMPLVRAIAMGSIARVETLHFATLVLAPRAAAMTETLWCGGGLDPRRFILYADLALDVKRRGDGRDIREQLEARE